MKGFLTLFVFILSLNTKAATLFHNVSVSGSGCDDMTTASVVSPDGSALSLIFDEFLMDSAESTGTSMNKTCQIEIETEIPVGHRIKKVDLSADFRGYLFLEKGIRASFQALFMEWVSPDSRFQSRARKILVKEDWSHMGYEPLEEDLLMTGSKSFPTPHGDCATEGHQKSKIVLKTMMLARVIPAFIRDNPQFLMTLDSADLTGQLQVNLQTQECKPGHYRRGRNNGHSGAPRVNPGRGNGRGRGNGHNPCRGPYHWDSGLRSCVPN